MKNVLSLFDSPVIPGFAGVRWATSFASDYLESNGRFRTFFLDFPRWFFALHVRKGEMRQCFLHSPHFALKIAENSPRENRRPMGSAPSDADSGKERNSRMNRPVAKSEKIGSFHVLYQDSEAGRAACAAFLELVWSVRPVCENGGGYQMLKENRIKGNVIRANVGGFDFVLKQMKPGKHAMAKILKSLVCGGNAFRLFRKMNFAFSCGFHRSAEIFLAAERRVAGCVVESFVVMEYVQGASVTRENAEEYGCEVAEIVDELHRFGIIHGDVCPDNFIVEEKTGILKSIDVSGKFSTPMARGYDLYSVASRFSQPFPERHFGMRLWMLREKARTNLRRLRLKLFRRNEKDDA